MKKHSVSGNAGLDSIDRKILTELCRDGRIANNELASRVGLSASPCWARVRELESRGFIKGYGAIVDRAALGLTETVVVEVTLHKHRGAVDALDSFARAIEQLPEVIDASMVAGDFDYYVRVAVSSTAAYEHFLREKLYRIPVVARARSIVVLREIVRPIVF